MRCYWQFAAAARRHARAKARELAEHPRARAAAAGAGSSGQARPAIQRPRPRLFAVSARGGGPPFNGAEPGGAAHGAIAAAASQRSAPDPQEKADSAPAGFPLHKSTGRPTSPPGVPLARAHTVLVAKGTCISSALATSAISAETSAFDSGTASTTTPARASRLGACATPKTSATNSVLYCAARPSTFGCGVVCEVKASMRSCLAHVCSRKCADLLFVHHRQCIGQARRRLVMLHHTTTPCAREEQSRRIELRAKA